MEGGLIKNYPIDKGFNYTQVYKNIHSRINQAPRYSLEEFNKIVGSQHNMEHLKEFVDKKYDLTKEELNYINKFDSKDYPEFIHNYTKSNRNEELLVNFFNKFGDEIDSFEYKPYQAILHRISSDYLKSRFNFEYTAKEQEKIAKLLVEKPGVTMQSRAWLIDEISGYSGLKHNIKKFF